MNIGKTYLYIISSEPLIDISTRDIGDHKHAKIKVNGIFNIILIEIRDRISVNNGTNTLTYTFTSMWSNPSLGYLIEFINGELSQDIFTINDQSGMVTINQGFQIENVSQMIKYLLGIYKNNEIKFKPSNGTPYIVIRYRQNTNHYNKILDNPIVDNQYQSINVNLFFIGGLFMLNLLKFKRVIVVLYTTFTLKY
jgi:hypothetical protein